MSGIWSAPGSSVSVTRKFRLSSETNAIRNSSPAFSAPLYPGLPKESRGRSFCGSFSSSADSSPCSSSVCSSPCSSPSDASSPSSPAGSSPSPSPAGASSPSTPAGSSVCPTSAGSSPGSSPGASFCPSSAGSSPGISSPGSSWISSEAAVRLVGVAASSSASTAAGRMPAIIVNAQAIAIHCFQVFFIGLSPHTVQSVYLQPCVVFLLVRIKRIIWCPSVVHLKACFSVLSGLKFRDFGHFFPSFPVGWGDWLHGWDDFRVFAIHYVRFAAY